MFFKDFYRVRFQTLIKSEKIDTRVVKSPGKHLPKFGSTGNFLNFFENIFERKIKTKSNSHKSEFIFQEENSKRCLSTMILLLKLLSFCNPIFSNFDEIFNFLKGKFHEKSLESFTLDIAYGFEIKVDIEETTNWKQEWGRVEKWAKK